MLLKLTLRVADWIYLAQWTDHSTIS